MNNYQYNLSIIIPAYNAARYIERTITEASKIVPTPEIIVVNDGSQDDTYSVCKHLQKKIPTLYIYSQPNSGVSVARNLGIQQSHGKWLFFCDSDDWVEANQISNILRIADRQKENILILAAMNFVKPEGIMLHTVENERFFTPNEYLDSILFQGSSCNYLFPQKLIATNQITFPAGVVNSEDQGFNIKCICCSSGVYSINTPIYNYNHFNGNAAHKTNKSLKWRIGPLESAIDLLSFCKAHGISTNMISTQIERLVEYYYRSHIYGKHTNGELKQIVKHLIIIGSQCTYITKSMKYKVITISPALGIRLLKIYNYIKFRNC